MGRLRVPARQPVRTSRRALVSRRRVPQLVQRAPEYAHARHRLERTRRSAAVRCTSKRRARQRRAAMTQRWRLADKGAIDRTRPLAFDYDGTRYEGYAGDTLASALLANGVHLVGRSFKYHRPRGIYSAGVEEPNALVQLARGARTDPNAPATTVELYDGLVATSQNCWPSVRFDVGAVANALSPLLPAGFYYKTFMWPPTPRGWLRYEHHIRRAAGLGRSAVVPDPDRYEHQYAHCDVLVIGGGVAGLSAGAKAARAGTRVLLCDERPVFGGSLIGQQEKIDGAPADAWLAATVREL